MTSDVFRTSCYLFISNSHGQFRRNRIWSLQLLDTTIYVVGNTVDDITTALQAVLDQVNSWCLSNRLVLHEGKSEAMVLSITPFVGPLKHLKWGEDTIRYVSSTKCLGVTIDDKLSWSQHISLARSAFNAKIKMLRRINFSIYIYPGDFVLQDSNSKCFIWNCDLGVWTQAQRSGNDSH